MVINHLLTGMILQVLPSSQIISTLRTSLCISSHWLEIHPKEPGPRNSASFTSLFVGSGFIMMILLEGDFWNVSWIWSFKISWIHCWVHVECTTAAFSLSDVLETCSSPRGKINPKMISFQTCLDWLVSCIYTRWFPGMPATFFCKEDPAFVEGTGKPNESPYGDQHSHSFSWTGAGLRKPFFGWLDLLLSDLDSLVENDSIWWGFFSVGWNQHQE